ncbi:hypothetical protein SLNWT_0612 [Streptomyces albus]|uniref:Thioesterase n=1 Tax=Streptomyces albus (strain ATCC 21838 / DSM 41398 / FERM P-419 / JCM 4703 / NBRC 107858) TaxID=1081613 RepID=A0A0B5EG32_STRA4|nr:hypothetical protein SLNWT_0612 [Streptomyces albus]AOU75300.1 hypothetical protein SLNHY_0609 [Streptomyces albus]AYN31105.1 thioesterase [Streptomyces albus]
MAQPYSVPVTVRGYETDTQGHLNQAVYLQYAEHARWSLLQEAGIRQSDLLAQGIGPAALETTIKYRRELHAGDEVEVSCAFVWGEGKTFTLEQSITLRDGTLSAQVTAVGGILDLAARKLVPDPAARMRALARKPELLGL